MSLELLKKAAKAAGALRFEYVEKLDDHYNDMAGHPTSGLRILDAVDGLGHFPSDRIWNPLTDDGDAFRLAVKLNLRVVFHPAMNQAIVREYHATDREWVEYVESHSDPYAATRLAIIRAAAAIGRRNARS